MEGESKISTINGAGVSVCKGCPADYWTPPTLEGKFMTGLMVNNSMAGAKVEFIPQRHSSKRITWYGCGPTVYDAPHMGHARTYVAFDVIRRILSDYFGYDVVMCMNITDIDDKIIKRAIEKDVDFATLARYWETVFFEEMKLLNVKLPDVVTRVSEYVPEVISFIEQIMKNGFAYASQGSVYFDTQTFRSSSKHVYGRMEPSSVNDQARVLEGEGELGIVTEKRCPLDFALWKKAKEGEPSWESPWGNGRPGWHIECSAMASSILGFPIDIHSGGIDLRFPHHDNELAQSEACYDQPQWVNYFLHSGHLHIKGSKMSKSLKNFITIKEALEVFTPRSIRLLTLLQRWDAPMNYSADGESMTAAAELDQTFSNFFGVVNASIRDAFEMAETCVALQHAKSLTDLKLKGLASEQRWNNLDVEFHEKVLNCQDQVHQALLDNFDTPTALLALRALVTDSHVYMKPLNSKAPLVLKAARYIFRMLKIFGITSGNEAELDYVSAGGDSAAETNLMNCLSEFRQHVRSRSQGLFKLLKSQTAGQSHEDVEAMKLVKELLDDCDCVRDQELIELGIQLEDMPNGSVWKKSTRDELLRERERKVQEEKKKQEKAQQIERLKAEAKLKKEEEIKLSPIDYYRQLHLDQYSEFDNDGIPTKAIDGTSISKSKRDKLIKCLEKHRAAHEAWKLIDRRPHEATENKANSGDCVV